MSLWTLEPRDPLVVRDGRPNDGRSESAALPFPHPGTVAGMVRTRLGSDEDGVFDTTQDATALLDAAIRGPLLVRLDGDALHVPQPRDAVVTGQRLRRLVPQPLPEGALLDGKFFGAPLGFAREQERSPGKAPRGPTWWPWDLFARWLSEPDVLDGGDAGELLADGLPDLPFEARVHVKLSDTWTAEEGMLFQTRGLRFSTPAGERLALAVDVDAAAVPGRMMRAGIGPNGGKRRLARWEPAPSLSLPGLSDSVRAALVAEGRSSVRVRVVLLTPALFAQGWKPGAAPGELLGPRCGITPALVAACVPRAETISGWDFARQQPKRTRRLVPAGSVYWLDLEGVPDDRVRWAEEVMMHNVSDALQDRRDGFGLAAVGVGS